MSVLKQFILMQLTLVRLQVLQERKSFYTLNILWQNFNDIGQIYIVANFINRGNTMNKVFPKTYKYISNHQRLYRNIEHSQNGYRTQANAAQKKYLESTLVVDVIKLFLRKSGKSRFPLKPKQQELALLKATKSFLVQFCLKIAQFSHFCAGSDIRTNFIQFLNFAEFQISSKKSFITSTLGMCLMSNSDL